MGLALARHTDRGGGAGPVTGAYIHYCIERIGPERCMFESNFPPDKVSCSYPVLWNGFKRLSAQYSEHERAALFHDTATRVYRIEL